MNPNTSLLKIDRKKFDPDTGRQIKKATSRGSRNRRVIKTVTIGEYEFSYHATRGWRKNKI